MYPQAWKIVLTTNELLVHPNLREMLAETERTSNVMALRFRSLVMIGNDSIPLDQLTSLLNQRTQYISNTSFLEKHGSLTPDHRYILRYPYARYIDEQSSISKRDWQSAPVGFIADYRYAFSFQHKKDKFSTLTRMTSDDLTVNEYVRDNSDLTQSELNKENLKLIQLDDLRNGDASNDELRMAHRLWREMTDH